MKKLLILLLGLLLSGSALRAQTITIGTGTSEYSDPLPGWYGWSRNAMLYTSNEIGVPTRGVIQSIAYDISTTNSTTGRTMKIYMMEVPDTVLTSTLIPNWNTIKNLATLVYESPLGGISFPTAGWETFLLDSPFQYTGASNLLVLVEGVGCTTSGGCAAKCRYTTTTNNKHWYRRLDGSSPPSDATDAGSFTTSYRANIQLTITGDLTCPYIGALVTSGITSNNANISWTGGGSESQWLVSYKITSDANWTVENDLVYTTNYSFPNALLPNTNYTIKVRAYCGVGDTSLARTITFTTACGSGLPITEGFENTSTTSPAAPRCWEYLKTGTASMYASSTYAHTGSKSYYLTLTPGTTNEAILISPLLTDDIRTVRLRFWMRYSSTSGCMMRTGYMSDPTDISTFHEVASYIVPTTFTLFTTYFDTVQGAGQYIAISANKKGSASTNYLYIDDVTIELLPECPDVNNITSTPATNDNSITLSFNTIGTIPSSFNVEYREVGTNTWQSTTFYTSPGTITGLTPLTAYEIRMQSYCGSDVGEWSNVKTISTTCVPTVLPLYEGFETTGTSNPSTPSCWSYIKTYASSSLSGSTTSSYVYSGTKGYYMYNSSSAGANDKMMLVSPYLQEDIATLRVRFFAKYTLSYANKLRIGYMSDPADGSTFRKVDSITLTSDWRKYIVNFDTVTGTGNYIAFDVTVPSTANYAALDEVIIEKIPNCPDVNLAILKITNVTATTVDISSDEILPETSNYDIRYRVQGTTTWTEDLNVTFPHQISGLTLSTYYEISVRSNCGSGNEGAWTYPTYFWTAFSIPLTQYFDSTTIAGWYYARVGTTGSVSATTTAGTYVSSPQAVYLANGIYAPNDKLYWKTPKIDPTIEMNSLQVRFKAKANAAGQSLSVGVMNSENINSFELVELVPVTTEWATYIVNFSNYTGTNYNIAFGHNGNAPATNIYMDNVDITYIPACEEASNFMIPNVTEQSIDLSWRSTQTASYVIEYGVEGSGTVQTQTSSTNSISLQSLTAGTTYAIRVKSNCTPELWSDTLKITTLLYAPTSIPFIEDFENASDWVFVNGSQTNQWVIDTAAKYSGLKSLYISNDTGAHNKYTISATSTALTYAYAVRAITFAEASDYLITYDWRNKGENNNNYDCLRILLIPASIPLPQAGVALNLLSGINLYGGNYGLSWVDTWQHNKEVVFHVSQPGAYNLVVYWYNDNSGGTQPPAAIDNISIEKLTCLVPSAIRVSNLTKTTADINYKVTANTQSIRFVYSSSLGTDSVDHPISNYQTDTVFQLTNLQSGTVYQLYASADCGGGDGSPSSATYSFQTVIEAPWLETFDSSGTTFPPTLGWSRKEFLYTPSDTMRTANMSTVTSVWVQGTVDGSKTAYINIYGATRKHWLMTPIIDIGTAGNYSLCFDVKLSDLSTGIGAPSPSPDDKFIVLISKDAGLTWAPADATVWDTTTNSAHPYNGLNQNWQSINIPLTNYTGNIKIAFYGESTVTVSGSDDWLHIDNVSIVSCAKPSNFAVSNVVPTSATVSWTHVTTTNFVVESRVDTTGATWIPSNVTGTNTVLTLMPNTEYLVRAKTNCGSGDYSLYTTEISFKTPCSAPALPIFENFDNTAIGSSSSPNAPTCWSYVRDYSSAYTYVYSSSPHSSPNCYYLYNSTSTAVQKTALISPYFTDPINTVRTRFRAKGGSGYRLHVGYLTNPSDMATFVLRDSIVFTNSLWDRYIISFDTVTTTANYIAFVHGQKNTSQSIYLDNISIENIPLCGDVVDDSIRLSNILQTTVTVSWPAISSATGYEIEYKESGQTAWLPPVSSTTNSQGLINLTPNTYYNIRVRSICGTNAYGAWSDPIKFRTACLPALMPIFENFDNTATGTASSPNAPSCWSYIRDFSSAYAYVYATSPNSTPNCYYLYNSTSSATQKTALISPYFNDPITTLRTRFMAKSTSGYVLHVGYMTNPTDPNTFTIQDSVVFTGSTWTQYIISFAEASSTGNYIAFMHGQKNTSQSIYLDDIAIEPIPACADITGLVCTNSTINSITMKWDTATGATGYELRYRSTNESNESTWYRISPITADSCVITGLDASSSYQIQVRVRCNTNDTGAWLTPILEASTACGLKRLPLLETFTSAKFPPVCWDRMEGTLPETGAAATLTTATSTNYSAWRIRPFANTGTNSMAMDIYGTTNTADWMITPDIGLGNVGDAVLEFDLALTAYQSTNPVTETGTSEKFMVLVSNNNNWTINDTIVVWDNVGSTRIFDSIATAGEHITIPLTGRTGNVRIAFYAVKTVIGGDNDLYIDNIVVTGTGICDPVTTVTAVATGTSVKVDWTALAGQTQWKVACKQSENLIASQIVNTPTYTFNELQRGFAYTFEVYNICRAGDTSEAVVSTPVTINPCNNVSNVTVVRACPTSAIISFTAATGQNQWQMSYQASGDVAITKVINRNRDTITGLTPNTPYEVKIRPVCGEGDTGNYNAPVSVQTGTCAPIENLTVPRIGFYDTIFASWYDNECHQSWEVSVVPEGEPIGEPMVVHTFQGVNLKVNPDPNYDVYVRGNCGDGEYGEWVKVTSPGLNHITPSESSSVKVNLAPNPAKDYTKLSIEGVSGEVEMILVTPEGRVLRKEKLLCQPMVSKDITLQGMAKGTYLIHLTHKNWTKVEKLIVQ